MITTDLGEIIYSFSRALDLSANGIAYHHQTVALISSAVAQYLEISKSDQELLFFSALVHDVGVTSQGELKLLLCEEDQNPYPHCQKAYEIFSSSKYLKEIGENLLYHHDRWKGPNYSGLKGDEIPLISSIIYLADRVAVKVELGTGYILHRHKEIINDITEKSGTQFNPSIVDAFLKAAAAEAFWLDLCPDRISDLVLKRIPIRKIQVTSLELQDIAYCFAQVIDHKSPFTHHHSTGVAAVAEFLATKIGFSEYERLMIKLAGYLHDLGKIAVPNEILDKPSKLTEEEFAIIKQHPYHSFQLLRNIPGIELAALWGPNHHEKLNGQGYPYRLNKKDIALGAKIMAVSDIFTALTEDRPYRKGLRREECLDILKKSCDRGELDEGIVKLVEENYNELFSIIKNKTSNM